jgi:hypothetical protein
MKRVGVIQSNYIPWKGYFDIINMVDEFIFYDCVQYTKNDWRNRNKIKTPEGGKWITIPVHVESLSQTIQEVKISDKTWAQRHWSTISQWYAAARYYKEYKNIFEEAYLSTGSEYLCEINHAFIKLVNNLLGIPTKMRHSSEFNLQGKRLERLVDLLEQTGATLYLSGPAAKEYLMEPLFEEAKISIEWMDYSNYPEYSQAYPPFDHAVSIIDLIFNEGPDAQKYMKSFSASKNL